MFKRNHSHVTLLTLFVCAMALATAIAPRGAHSGSSQAALKDSLYPSDADRFGIDVSSAFGQVGLFDVARVRAGWYIDWSTKLDPPAPAGMEFVQTIWTLGDVFAPSEAGLAALVAANPGATWTIGNEPDCIWQGNSTPDQYARLYHRLYTFLKALDPTCRVTVGGIVQATPLRMQWLKEVWTRYKDYYGTNLPVDLWNIHTFVLREERGQWGCDIPPGFNVNQGMLWQIKDHDRLELVIEQIVRFRTWMRDIGERDKELIITEYGILVTEEWEFDEARAASFMRQTFDYFLNATDPYIGCPRDGNRLVQRWAWFSLNVDRMGDQTLRSHLFESESKTITSLGVDYESYAAPLYTPYVDLTAARVGFATPPPLSMEGEPVTASLKATIRNAGNSDAENVSVQFWVGSPAHPIGPAHVIAVLPARKLTNVFAQWIDAPVGMSTIGVTADVYDLIDESNETNNQISRALLIAQHEVYLPLVSGH